MRQAGRARRGWEGEEGGGGGWGGANGRSGAGSRNVVVLFLVYLLPTNAAARIEFSLAVVGFPSSHK